MWLVGLYTREASWAGQTTFSTSFVEGFETEERAWQFYQHRPNNRTRHTCSRALWNLRKPQNDGSDDGKTLLLQCSTADWDREGLGVATLVFQLQDHLSTHHKQRTQTASLTALLMQRVSPEVFQIVRNKLADCDDESPLPFVPPDRSDWAQRFFKNLTCLFFQRSTVEYFACGPYKRETLYCFPVGKYPSVRGYVALTLDDCPSRFGARDLSELPTVLDLLKEYDCQATFMAIGSWLAGPHEPDLVRLLQEGHELGNHGMMDRSYEFDNPHKFADTVESCNQRIQALQAMAGVEPGVKWFRAPHGRFTEEMAKQLHSKHLTNVMCDTYASCPIVRDGEFIARHLTTTCQHGSIILIHMPEKPIRQWCLTGLVGLLKGLREQNLKAVTISELTRLAGRPGKN